MFENRITRYLSDEMDLVGFVELPAATQHAAPVGMLVVPVALAPTSWQTQVYQMAYQRAVSAVAEARRYRRFFSVWN